jgi:hypothetical protein
MRSRPRALRLPRWPSRQSFTAGIAIPALFAAVAGCSGGGAHPPSPVPIPTLPPSQDAFYRPPADLAGLAHGAVIRTRPATVSTAGVAAVASARTVVFASTDIHGRPVAASETIFTPKRPWIDSGTRPLISYQPPYDSLSADCSPSYAMQVGAGQPVTANQAQMELPIVRALAGSGAEVVVPDYEGPRALFGIGDQEGRIVLDGIRAAEQAGYGGVTEATRTVAWGYSGGALASAWAAELQPQYAPRLTLVGVAEGGVPADVKQVMATINGGRYFQLAAMVLVSIERAYPGVKLPSLLSPHGRKVLHAIRNTCGGSPVLTALANQSLASLTTAPDPLGLPRLQPVFDALRLGHRVPTAAIYNYQGTADQVVPYAADRALVDFYCSRGATVEFKAFRGLDHLGADQAGLAPAAQWLRDRLDGVHAPSNCAS